MLDWGLREGLRFTGAPAEWPAWLISEIRRRGVSDLIVYGDSHPYVVTAISAAKTLGLSVHVFEQGYLRPDWITLERDGVNGSSGVSRDPSHYRDRKAAPAIGPAVPVGPLTPPAVRRIVAYHAAVYAGSPAFPRYRLPYSQNALLQSLGHARRFIAQRIGRHRELARLERALASPEAVFLALLQRPGDSQLSRYSTFRTNETFADHLIQSFAKHAPTGSRLIFKVHPLDPGLQNYHRALGKLAQAAALQDRIWVVDGGRLGDILPRVTGVAVNNSTGGLSAIEFGRPTIVLGQAIYDIDGLTNQNGLTAFWCNPTSPNSELYEAFRAELLATSQINGAYGTRFGVELAVAGAINRLLGR